MRAKIITISLLLGTVLLACSDERLYLGDGKLYQVALTSATMPVVQGEDGALYIVETRAELPIREPTAAELAGLREGVRKHKNLPFTRLPWVVRGELELQVDFTLSNLDNAKHDIDVIINGANEFHEYVPTVVDIDDAALPLHAQWEWRFTLEPRARVTRSVREDELDEVAVDLATVVNGAPNSDEVVYFENKSSSDERNKPFIPEVVPGLTALRFGVRSLESANVLLEATVRVRSVVDKLAETGERRMRIEPVLFESVVPAN